MNHHYELLNGFVLFGGEQNHRNLFKPAKKT